VARLTSGPRRAPHRRPRLLLLVLACSLALITGLLAGPAVAQESFDWPFSGRVYAGAPGDDGMALGGVVVRVFGSGGTVFWQGSQRVYQSWSFIDQTRTDSGGSYRLDVGADDGAVYRSLLLTVEAPPGYMVAGGSSPTGWYLEEEPGILVTSGAPDVSLNTWLGVQVPAGYPLSDNDFWLSPAGGFDLGFGDAGFQSFDGPDLVVWAEVFNHGNSTSPPALALAENAELAWWGYPADVPSLGPGQWTTVFLRLPVLDSLRDRTVDVYVNLDPDNELPELDEANNGSWIRDIYIPPPALPDLVVALDRSWFDDNGETLVLVAAAINQGQAQAGEHLLAVWSEGSMAGGSGVAPLAPGASRAVEIRIGVPINARGTRVAFTMEIDANGEVREANEENNVVRTAPVEIPTLPPADEPHEPDRPDLVVAYRSHSFDDDGRTLVLSLRATNQGGARAKASNLSVRAAGWASGSERVATLAAGEQRNVEVALRVPESARGTNVAFTLEIDADGEVNESNEDNNTALASRLPIPRRATEPAPAPQPPQSQLPPRARPDLLMTFDNATVRNGGQSLMLSLWVTNQGGARAPAHHFRVSAPGWQAVSYSVAALDAGSRRRVEVTLAVPESARGRSALFSIVADSRNQVAEADEGNNTTRTSLQIPAARPTTGSQRPQQLEWPPWAMPAAAAAGLIIAVAALRYFLSRGGEGPPAEEEPGEPAPAPLPPLRLLRLWVTEGASGVGPPVAEDRPLVTGAAYTMHLQVQPPGQTGTPARRAPGAETDLDVVFFTPASDFGLERTGTLRLPERGASNEIRRPFVPARPGRHQIRAALYYRNNLLQSAVLDAAVAAAEAPRQPGAVRRLVDYVANARLDDLAQLPRPALSIFVNSAPGGSHWIGLYSRDERAAPQLHDGDLHTFGPRQLDALAGRTRDLFLRIEGLRHYTHEIALPLDEATVARRERNLVNLARNGYRLFDELFLSQENGLAPERLEAFHQLLQEPATIAIARCRGDSTTMPWAALYDRYLDVERELALCPVFKRQVTRNEWAPDQSRLLQQHDLLDNPAACRAQSACPGRGPQAQTTVCPFGFWGMLHQIEQPLHQVTPTPVGEAPPELADPAFEQTLFLERPARTRPKMALNAFPRLRFAERHRQEFEALARSGAVELVYETDRDQALALLQQGGHHLYYFYCHGIVEDNVFKLKLGPADEPGYISSANLNPLAIHWPAQPHPLVILNGCATMALTPELVHGFMGKLRRLGAAGIVGSEVQVWEGLACPFGYLVVSGLLSGHSLGEAFLDARRQLQRQLNPLGLVYAYYARAGLHLHDPDHCYRCRSRQPAVA
jgi:subtilase family serine protease